jgi:hypothetical protein
MAFMQAMDRNEAVRKIAGEKGCPAHKGTSQPALDLFFGAIRSANLADLLSSAITACDNDEDRVNFIVLAFQTRATRGIGKGEKELFHQFLRTIRTSFGNDVVCKLLTVIPHYGCWKDIVNIYLDPNMTSDVRNACIKMMIQQLRDDKAAFDKDGSKASISLLPKYIPRQGGHAAKTSSIYTHLTTEMYGKAGSYEMKMLRVMVTKLTNHLGVVEQLMSAGKWSEIDPSKVPSLALDRYRKAFMNEMLKVICPPHMEETGNRHPHNDARVALRKALREAVSTKGIKGKQLFPHEIVQKCMKGILSSVEKDFLNAQWSSMREGVLKVISDYEKQLVEKTASLGIDDARSSKTINLGKLIALCDVSGSMDGPPMEVSIALGILVSQITNPKYRHRVLTFETNPNWVTLDPDSSIFDLVKRVQNAGWGGSTNFQAACEKILAVAESNRLNPEEIPDLIVFSDMQFDSANGSSYYYGSRSRQSVPSWETALETLTRRFAEVGTKVCGKPWLPPKIIFWNLRGDTRGVPATADTPNVQLLSGFSPSLLKLLLSGSEMKPDDPASSSSTITPMETYLAAVNDNAFDLVRMLLSDITTGIFAEYKFEPEVLVKDTDDFEVVPNVD